MPDIDTLDLGRGKGDCIPIFHMETRPDDAASEEAGKPIFKEVPYVEIIAPGNDKEVVNRRVKEADKERWPKQWAAFQNGQTEVELDGMPIEEWPQISKAQAATLKASHILTVEQLAEVADQNIGNLGFGMMELKKKAKVYLELQDGEASVQKYAQKNRRLKERVKLLEEQVEALKSRKDNEAPD